MNGFRMIRALLAVFLVLLAVVAFIQGDLVTAALALVGAAFGALFVFGMRDADAKAGHDWRKAEPWGKWKADAFMMAMIVLISLPVLSGLD